jgi:hypothetical protein
MNPIELLRLFSSSVFSMEVYLFSVPSVLSVVTFDLQTWLEGGVFRIIFVGVTVGA